MDKEKEIEEMYSIVKVALDIQLGDGDVIDPGDKQAAAEMVVEDLQKAGYGNVKQAVKEFAAELKKRGGIEDETYGSNVVISYTEIEELIKELYEDD